MSDHEFEQQLMEGRRRATGETVAPGEEMPLTAWLRATLALLVSEPERVIVTEEHHGLESVILSVDPGSDANTARILGKTDPVTGYSTVRALRALVGKIAGRQGLMVELRVNAERRPMR